MQTPSDTFGAAVFTSRMISSQALFTISVHAFKRAKQHISRSRRGGRRVNKRGGNEARTSLNFIVQSNGISNTSRHFVRRDSDNNKNATVIETETVRFAKPSNKPRWKPPHLSLLSYCHLHNVPSSIGVTNDGWRPMHRNQTTTRNKSRGRIPADVARLCILFSIGDIVLHLNSFLY